MLVGQGKKFELWNYDDWNKGREKWLSTKDVDLSNLPSELGTLSL
jgi:DNA-binding transcriptional regulator/RsmH inhibitor MraZ